MMKRCYKIAAADAAQNTKELHQKPNDDTLKKREFPFGGFVLDKEAAWFAVYADGDLSEAAAKFSFATLAAVRWSTM